MSTGDTARTHHEMARWELIQRIQLRDNVLLIYLGAVGTIFGIALGSNAKSEILLIIPYLALGASIIISQHHSMIGSIGYFLAHELEPYLKEIGEYAPQWDTSIALKARITDRIWKDERTIGHVLLINIPPILGLILNWHHVFYLPLLELLFWWSGVILIAIAVVVMLQSRNRRLEFYKQLKNLSERKDNKEVEQISNSG